MHYYSFNRIPSNFLQSMVTELCSGPCMVLEIHGTDTPRTFREFCGPADPVSEIIFIDVLFPHMYTRSLSN